MLLNKFLAHAGVTSRRKAAELIKLGYVRVNKETVTDPSYEVQPEDKVFFDGKLIQEEKKIYIILNKPKGYVVTVEDEEDRPTVLELLKPSIKARVYPMGRLDLQTTGVLLMTNDGTLAQKLAHPKQEVEKVYQLTLDREINETDAARLKEGIRLYDGFMKVDHYAINPRDARQLRVTIHSGKNRILRRLFEGIGYKVRALDRIMFGGITHKGLAKGTWRFLSKREIEMLYSLGK